MFYTKYRPQNFSAVSRPNETADALMNQVSSGKVGHAYLFIGPRGTGKTTIARILAKSLNCTNITKEGDACGKCETCLAIQKGNYIDVIEIDAASNRGIDDIRDLRDKIKLAPSKGKNKVYVIDEVHMLTSEAFNALLKTLEEPPVHVYFILCTTEAHKVPETIRSRCQVFKFKRATLEQLVTKLEEIAKIEGAKITKEELKTIAKASQGGFRDAETMLQQVVEGNMSTAFFTDANSTDSYVNFIKSTVDGDIASALRQINKSVEDGVDLKIWTNELLHLLRDLLFISSGAGSEVMDTTVAQKEEIVELTNHLSEFGIVKYIEIFMEAANKIDWSGIPQLPLELAVIKLVTPEEPVQIRQKKTVKNEIPVTVEDVINDEIDKPEVEDVSGKIQGGAVDNNKGHTGIEIEEVKNKWNEIIKSSVSHNHSINALLKACKPLRIDKNNLILEVYFAFHKERIETPKNREIIEAVLNEVLRSNLRLKCEVNTVSRPGKKKGSKETGELTDLNIIPALDGDVNVAEIFDGGLPL